ncbi:hypothetical protein BBAD15_g7907 [Beauveria bassiana D1-5]|uniref:Uncharacterized protein n=1 Tax=Beauveria bassiana D1-5 TaxID=1245745 RepID=A0A0A2VGU0_BEABA|nr:hypothetical protein BBAD15_g7907 [Beauveria bassiana D1-5]
MDTSQWCMLPLPATAAAAAAPPSAITTRNCPCNAQVALAPTAQSLCCTATISTLSGLVFCGVPPHVIFARFAVIKGAMIHGHRYGAFLGSFAIITSKCDVRFSDLELIAWVRGGLHLSFAHSDGTRPLPETAAARCFISTSLKPPYEACPFHMVFFYVNLHYPSLRQIEAEQPSHLLTAPPPTDMCGLEPVTELHLSFTKRNNIIKPELWLYLSCAIGSLAQLHSKTKIQVQVRDGVDVHLTQHKVKLEICYQLLYSTNDHQTERHIRDADFDLTKFCHDPFIESKHDMRLSFYDLRTAKYGQADTNIKAQSKRNIGCGSRARIFAKNMNCYFSKLSPPK